MIVIKAQSIRETYETYENENLSDFACKSSQSKGREINEQPCDIRTSFARDRDRILHCKAFRRLKRKTQVFLAPEGDHYRTRLTHTLEVAQIARTIARALKLNEDLTEAIALGHDLGHTPFGHAGESALNEINDIGFTHFNQSVRVVKYLEKDFSGLNLTYEVIDGIANHTKGKLPETLEGVVVRISDKIAYLNHDIEDAISAKVLKDNEIPKDIINSLGSSKSVRITHLIKSIIENSLYKNQIIMDCFTQNAFDNLNTFMYKKVYFNTVAKFEEKKVFALIKNLYDYFYNNPEFLPVGYKLIMEKEGKNMAISDYIAGMTDSFAISFYEQLFVPKSWKIQQINNN